MGVVQGSSVTDRGLGSIDPWIGTGVERGSTGGLAVVGCAWGRSVAASEGVKGDFKP